MKTVLDFAMESVFCYHCCKREFIDIITNNPICCIMHEIAYNMILGGEF